MNDDKTKFYEQVLELEPESRLFFPLARIYFEQNQIRKAKQTLENGLNRHPRHFEARLLLATVLIHAGDQNRARQIYMDIFSLFREDRLFWENLTDILSGRGEKDLSLAAAFFARSGSDKAFTWTDVLKTGMDHMGSGLDHKETQSPGGTADTFDMGEDSGQESQTTETLTSQNRLDETPGSIPGKIYGQEDNYHPEPAFAAEALDDDPGRSAKAAPAGNVGRYDDEEFEDPEELADFDIDNEARTKSMADILFGQEEYAKAHGIYRELWHNSLPGSERRELERMMARSEQAMSLDVQVGEQDLSAEDDGYDKDQLINFLKTLADRLEAK